MVQSERFNDFHATSTSFRRSDQAGNALFREHQRSLEPDVTRQQICGQITTLRLYGQILVAANLTWTFYIRT